MKAHCRKISDKKVAAAVEAKRDDFQDMLLASCREVGGDHSAPACRELGARLDEFLNYYLPAYCRADLSARHHHRAYSRASTAVFTLSALAVVIVAAQHLFHLPHWLVTGEILCIGMILLVFHWGNRSRWHRNWVDCRYFAERVRCGLHVAFLYGKSAVPEPSQLANCFVDGAWCNPEFEELMHRRPHPVALSEAHLGVLRHFMVEHWLRGQKSHHEGVATSKMRKHKIVSRLGESCFWLTLVAALLHLTPHAWRSTGHVEHLLTNNLLTFVVIALPAMGTALAGVRGHFDFKKISTRSGMIARQLEVLIRDANQATNLDELGLAVLRAEDLMIQENAGWHLNTADKVIKID